VQLSQPFLPLQYLALGKVAREGFFGFLVILELLMTDFNNSLVFRKLFTALTCSLRIFYFDSFLLHLSRCCRRGLFSSYFSYSCKAIYCHCYSINIEIIQSSLVFEFFVFLFSFLTN
jgi:hypothetical protein